MLDLLLLLCIPALLFFAAVAWRAEKIKRGNDVPEIGLVNRLAHKWWVVSKRLEKRIAEIDLAEEERRQRAASAAASPATHTPLPNFVDGISFLYPDADEVREYLVDQAALHKKGKATLDEFRSIVANVEDKVGGELIEIEHEERAEDKAIRTRELKRALKHCDRWIDWIDDRAFDG